MQKGTEKILHIRIVKLLLIGKNINDILRLTLLGPALYHSDTFFFTFWITEFHGDSLKKAYSFKYCITNNDGLVWCFVTLKVHIVLLEGSHYAYFGRKPTLGVTLLGAKCSHKLFGILLYERFIYSSYLFIESFIYSSIDSWIFTLYLGYKPELFYFSFFILYFSAQFVPALDSGWSFNWFQCVALK